MKTVEECYDIVRSKKPGQIAVKCLDFGTFYMFAMRGVDQDPNEVVYGGVLYDTVDKRTGEYRLLDVTSIEPSRYWSAKEVKLSTIMDAKFQ